MTAFVYLCLIVCSRSEPSVKVFKDQDDAFACVNVARETQPLCLARNYQIEMEVSK